MGKNYEMNWSTNKCYSILPTNETTTLTINNQPITNVVEGTYLGVSITMQGITDSHSQERINNAIKRVGMLRNLNLTYQHLTAKQVRNICNTFVYSVAVAEYAIHLTPPTQEVEIKWNRMDELVIRLMFGVFNKRFQTKIRKIAGLVTLTKRCSILLHKLEEKIRGKLAREGADERLKGEFEGLENYSGRVQLPRNQSKEEVFNKYNAMFTHHQRKTPTIKFGQEYPAMIKLKRNHTVNSLKWYIGTFPRDPSGCTRRVGEPALEAIQNTTRILKLEKWNDGDLETLKLSLDLLDEIQPEDWRKRKRSSGTATSTNKKMRK